MNLKIIVDDYFISTSTIHQHVKTIWSLLKGSYWSRNIPIEYVEKFLRHSLCMGVYQKSDNQLVGFGRAITDYVTYAYVCDIIIAPSHQKKGLGSALFSAIKNHPELRGLKTWMLRTTQEARTIYEKNGFKIVSDPDTLLEIDDLEIYSRLEKNNNCRKN